MGFGVRVQVCQSADLVLEFFALAFWAPNKQDHGLLGWVEGRHASPILTIRYNQPSMLGEQEQPPASKIPRKTPNMLRGHIPDKRCNISGERIAYQTGRRSSAVDFGLCRRSVAGGQEFYLTWSGLKVWVVQALG